MQKIAIVGAGIAGLTAAYKLKKAGFDVIVFESSDQVGGRMSDLEFDGVRFPNGAEFIQDGYENMFELIDELEIELSPMSVDKFGVIKDNKIEVFNTKNPLNYIYNNIITSLKDRLLGIKLLRLLWKHRDIDVADSDTLKELDTVLFSDWIDENLSTNIRRYLFDTMCRGTFSYENGSKDISAAYGIAMFKKLTGKKYFELKGGMGELTRKLANEINTQDSVGRGQIKTSSRVEQIKQTENQVEITVNGQKQSFDRLIIAIQGDKIKSLYNGITERAELFENIKYTSHLRCYFKTKVDFFKGCQYIAVPLKAELIFQSLSMFEKRDGFVYFFGGITHEVMDEMINTGLEDIESLKKIIKKKAKIIPEDSELIGVHFISSALPVLGSGYAKKLINFKKEIHKDNSLVDFCGDYIGGPFTEGALTSGLEAAERIISQSANISIG